MISRTILLSFLFLAGFAFGQVAPTPISPTKIGRMVRIDESSYINLSMVKRIEGKVILLYSQRGTEFPLTEKGIKDAIELVSAQIKSGATRLGVTAYVYFDEKGVAAFSAPAEPPVSDLAAITCGLKGALSYFDQILKLAADVNGP